MGLAFRVPDKILRREITANWRQAAISSWGFDPSSDEQTNDIKTDEDYAKEYYPELVDMIKKHESGVPSILISSKPEKDMDYVLELCKMLDKNESTDGLPEIFHDDLEKAWTCKQISNLEYMTAEEVWRQHVKTKHDLTHQTPPEEHEDDKDGIQVAEINKWSCIDEF